MGNLNITEIEQTKLLTNAFDRTSTACFTVGVLTPLAGFGYGVTAFASLAGPQVIVVLVGWLSIAAVLHYCARRTLKGLV